MFALPQDWFYDPNQAEPPKAARDTYKHLFCDAHTTLDYSGLERLKTNDTTYCHWCDGFMNLTDDNGNPMFRWLDGEPVTQTPIQETQVIEPTQDYSMD